MLTFALHYVCGSVKISGSVSRAGNAVVLAELHLIGSNGATDTTVGAGIVVMPWGALNCKDNMESVFVRNLECDTTSAKHITQCPNKMRRHDTTKGILC